MTAGAWVLVGVLFWVVAGGLVTAAVVTAILRRQAAIREQLESNASSDDGGMPAWLGADLVAITAHLIARDRPPGR